MKPKTAGGHAVAGHGAQRADIVIGAAVGHDAHGLDREQHGEDLPDRIVDAGPLGHSRDIASAFGSSSA